MDEKSKEYTEYKEFNEAVIKFTTKLYDFIQPLEETNGVVGCSIINVLISVTLNEGATPETLKKRLDGIYREYVKYYKEIYGTGDRMDRTT